MFLHAVAGAALTLAVPAYAAAQPAPAQVGNAVRAAVRGDKEIARFYQERGYRPLWLQNGVAGPDAEQLLHLIDNADADGLDPRRYRPQAIADALDAAMRGSPKAIARAEMLLSTTFANYVRDVRRHRDMGVVYTETHFRPVVPSKHAILTMAAAAPNLRIYLEQIGWMNPIYAQLRGALAAHRGYDGAATPVHIPPGAMLRPGSDDPRVRLLRYRLGLSPEGGYDKAVVSAVRELQRSYGRPVDGIAGPLTLALLNQGTPQNRQLLRLNLERARALPAQLGRRYVLVDAAAARLWMYEDGRAVDSMRVAVGKPSEATPMMAGNIRFLTLNPYWNVPPDLVRQRIAPGVATEGPRLLRRLRYEVLSDWGQNAQKVDPSSIDWRAVQAGRKEVRVRQLPGGSNAMGRMKIQFPNDLGIFLHDTPDRSVLREEDRLVSAGCVRLEDAPRLANWLFNGQAPRAEGSAPEQRQSLPEPVPVYITYLTAAPEPQGVALRADVYNRDPRQLAALYARPQQRSRR